MRICRPLDQILIQCDAFSRIIRSRIREERYSRDEKSTEKGPRDFLIAIAPKCQGIKFAYFTLCHNFIYLFLKRNQIKSFCLDLLVFFKKTFRLKDQIYIEIKLLSLLTLLPIMRNIE